VTVVAAERLADDTQRGAYSLLLVLSGVALGVSGLPAPLYGMYEEQWHLSPLATTLVFAVYAVAALGAVLVSGKISDVVGRKPVLLGALVAMIVGLGVFLIADNMAMLMVARIIHGAAVGSIVVAGAAALLDLRPDHGVRSGQLSGVSFNIGMTVAIVGSAPCSASASSRCGNRTCRGPVAPSGSPNPPCPPRSAVTSGSPRWA
jgi:MFS family permease